MDKDALLQQAPNSTHYKQCVIEPIQYIEANNIGFHAGNVIKYVTRAEKKDGIEDLKKARWYLDRLIELKTNERANG